MAGRGPLPKDGRSRGRDQAGVRVVELDGQVHGRPLPKDVLPDGEMWHSQTVAWWAAVRRWPLLADEPAVGWSYLVDTALLHHTMWSKGRWEFAAEVRLRVAKFGVTPEDRARLRISVSTPRPAHVEKDAAADQRKTDRRARIIAGNNVVPLIPDDE